MKTRILLFVVAGAACAATPHLWASEPGFSAGEWEFERTITGAPRKVPARVTRMCVSAGEIDEDAAAPIHMGMTGEGDGPDCELAQVMIAADGSTRSRIVCDGRRGEVQADIEGLSSATQFDLSGKLKVSMFTADIRYWGRRLGECSPG